MTGFKLLACLLGFTSIAASAAVYRWVDEDGHVHYTDKAVINSEVINVRTGTAKDAAPAPAADPTLSQDQLTRKKADCEQKKQQYESYRTAIKIVETDSLGRKHEYTPDEQKLLIVKAETAMKDTCAAAGVTLPPSQPTASTAPPTSP